jgi:hypothetical protein
VREFRHRVDPVDAQVAGLQQRIGYLNRSIEDLSRKKELSEILAKRMQQRESLAAEVESLRTKIDAMAMASARRRQDVSYRIVQHCVETLRADLPLEEAFHTAELVAYDFGTNSIAVDGRKRFSASSSTYLKNALLLSFFRLSLEDPAVRWPRFILLDNIEDKGMQPARSANFQEFVVSISESANVEHQIIMTTSMISPKIEDTEVCVGPHYNPGHKTLRV